MINQWIGEPQFFGHQSVPICTNFGANSPEAFSKTKILEEASKSSSLEEPQIFTGGLNTSCHQRIASKIDTLLHTNWENKLGSF